MLNKTMLIGYLGKDPEVRSTQGGKAVCNLSLATSEKFKDGEGNAQERTEWHSIVAWGKLAEICGQYLTKGRMVFVEGRLATQSWDDKQGQKHYKTEVIAEKVKFLGGDKGGAEKEKKSAGDPGPIDDDIPF